MNFSSMLVRHDNVVIDVSVEIQDFMEVTPHFRGTRICSLYVCVYVCKIHPIMPLFYI